MYSRSFSRRGSKDFGYGVRATDVGGREEPQIQKQSYINPVPPPLYGGTLYISAREGREPSGEKEVLVQTPSVMNTSNIEESRTVMYNGEPYVPDEIGIYTEEDEIVGRGGYPQTGTDRPFFKKNNRTIDQVEKDEKIGLGGLNLQSLFALAPETDDIILIALIITLLSSKASGVFSDDLLLIILGILLLSGRTEK